MIGYAPRLAAFRALAEQEATGRFLKDLLPGLTRDLEPVDRGLAREIAYGVLRRRLLLDWNLDALAARPPRGAKLRAALRLSAYQLLFLTQVPAHAAVNVGVELVKREVDRNQGGFANALLQRLRREGLKLREGDDLKALSVNTSHPLWLVKRWNRELGAAGLRRALEAGGAEPDHWVRVNPVRQDPEALRRALEAEGVATSPVPDLPLYLKLEDGLDRALRSAAFAAGGFSLQDPASGLVARLCAWDGGPGAIDLCAAPGGKSAGLVEGYRRDPVTDELRPPPAPLICNDLSFTRLRRIRDARERLGHPGLVPVVSDGLRPPFRPGFRLLLLDAPCSNLGVLRRRPEARWTQDEANIARLAARQGELLESAAALAAPGAALVYSTCSPEREETRGVVDAFLARHPDWSLADAGAFLPGRYVKERCLWLWPGETPFDAFFAARLERGGG